MEDAIAALKADGLKVSVDSFDAGELARANRAALKCLLVYPELPKSHEMYQDRYREFLLEQMDTAIRQARAALHLRGNDPPVTVELDAGADPPAVRMIRHALREVHDLVIKEAEPIEGGVGFTSLDMTLLRKCPCPVWLARPINRPKSEIRVAVAVSADNREASEHDLALRLLTLGRSLADTCNGELAIVLRGDLGAILRFTAGKKNPDFLSEAEALDNLLSQGSLVAGGRNRRSLRNGSGNAKTSAAEPTEVSQLSLVAGACNRRSLPELKCAV